MITRIRASYIIGFADGDHCIHRDAELVFEKDRVLFVGKGYAGTVHREIDAGNAIISPGFIDLDALADIDHALIDSWHGPETEAGLQWSEDYFRHRRHDVFPPDDVAFRREFALVQLIRNGITTAMPIAAETHNAWAETYDDLAAMAAIALRLGLRMYLGPAYRAGVAVTREDGSLDVLFDEAEGEKGLAEAIRFARDFDGQGDGLLRTCLLPCRVETMTLELMRATAAAAEALDCLVRIHCLQGRAELRLLKAWYGKGPVDILDETGLLGPRLLSPHGVLIGGHPHNPEPYAGEIERFAAAGASIVHCPLTLLRYGTMLADFDRWRDAGVTIALGTDSFPPDMIRNMDVGNHTAQWMTGRHDGGKAADYFRAATLGGAKALKRDDLGRLAPGAKADLVIIDLDDPRIGPVDDPIRTLVMNCTGHAVRSVIIDGRIVMQDGVIPGVDERAMRSRAQRYFETMKAAYSERDYRRRPSDALFPPSLPAAR